MSNKVRAIAFYLPQYHPIPENDDAWGTGFTEWTNVVKARPLFKGHYQPNLPADLGFYDLRVPEVRERQAELARAAGIEGFCYWHYWLGNGKRLLERVFNDVLESGRPEFPFCLGWANESWTGRWHGRTDLVIAQQHFPGADDYTAHFYALLSAFRDPRYIRIQNKPIFLVYRPDAIPDLDNFISIWNRLALENGLEGFYWISNSPDPEMLLKGFDRIGSPRPGEVFDSLRPAFLKTKISKSLRLVRYIRDRVDYRNSLIRDYRDYVNSCYNTPVDECVIPNVMPNWDNTPRSGRRGIVFQNASPLLYRELLEKAVRCIDHLDSDRRLLFIKSWNEWAEGNYLEPDQQWGNAYLKATADVLK